MRNRIIWCSRHQLQILTEGNTERTTKTQPQPMQTKWRKSLKMLRAEEGRWALWETLLTSFTEIVIIDFSTEKKKELNRKFHSVLCWLHFLLVCYTVIVKCYLSQIWNHSLLQCYWLILIPHILHRVWVLEPGSPNCEGRGGSKAAEGLRCRGQSQLSDPQGSDGAVGARWLLEPQNWGSAAPVVEGRKGVHAFGLHPTVCRFMF